LIEDLRKTYQYAGLSFPLNLLIIDISALNGPCLDLTKRAIPFIATPDVIFTERRGDGRLAESEQAKEQAKEQLRGSRAQMRLIKPI